MPKIAPRRPRENSTQWKFPQVALTYGVWTLLLICCCHGGSMLSIPVSISLPRPSNCNNIFVGEGQLTTKEVATLFFNGVVCTCGLPRVVLHNRNPRFASHFWKNLWALLGVHVALNMAHHPQTDGQTERAHHALE